MRDAITGARGGTSDASLDRLIGLAFWTLAVLCLLNLNGLLFNWTGAERFFSPLMLLLCCFLVFTGLKRNSPREALGLPGALILSCIASYVGIGIVVAIVNGTDVRTDATSVLTQYLSSAFVILAVAVGAQTVRRRLGGTHVLLGVAIILTASCGLILTSPWFLEVFLNPPEDGEYRYFGSFTNPNNAALMATYAVAVALAAPHHRRYRILVIGFVLVAVTAVVLTFSRTALLTLPAVAVMILLVARGTQRRRVALGIGIIALVATTIQSDPVSNALQEPQIARLQSLSDLTTASSMRDLSLAGRASLWQLAWEETQESPLIGNGLGSLHQLEEAWYNHQGVLMGAHNQYLILWGEAGFLPLLLFVSFLAAALRAGFRRTTAYWEFGTVTGWATTVAFFSMTFGGVLTHRTSDFIIGLSCAVMASRSRSATPAPTTIPTS